MKYLLVSVFLFVLPLYSNAGHADSAETETASSFKRVYLDYNAPGALEHGPLRRGCRWPRWALKVIVPEAALGKAGVSMERLISPLFSLEMTFSYMYNDGSAMGLATDHYKDYESISTGYFGGIRFLHPFYPRRPKAFFKRSHFVWGYYHEYVETNLGVRNIMAPFVGYGARFVIASPLYFELGLDVGPRVWQGFPDEDGDGKLQIQPMVYPRLDLCLIIF